MILENGFRFLEHHPNLRRNCTGSTRICIDILAVPQDLSLHAVRLDSGVHPFQAAQEGGFFSAPDGPMKAVTVLSRIIHVHSMSACFFRKKDLHIGVR